MSQYWVKNTVDKVPFYVFRHESEWADLRQKNKAWGRWADSLGFKALVGQVLCLPSDSGTLAAVVGVLGENETAEQYAKLQQKLPAGIYELMPEGFLQSEASYKQAIFLFCQACYEYTLEGDKPKESKIRFVLPSEIDFHREQIALETIDWVRDLINTPANYMMPPDLFLAAKKLCTEYGAELRAIQDRDLLAAGYEATYRVGQTGAEPPCLLDFTWGDEAHPLVALVGKGVCYDTGGLSLKTTPNMLTMKKDMGGAAHVLGLAKLIMANRLPIRLRVLIPAVENGIGKGAYRPGDVLRYKDGTTVEVTNTDAEGRLVVADGLLAACASQKKPDMLIDFTTLTGAARIAVGMDIAAFFTTESEEIASFMTAGEKLADPVWPLPLYTGYRSALKSHIADLSNTGSSSYGGAIVAALFLQHFVPKGLNWWHFDVSAWTEGTKHGAAVMGLRAMFAWLEKRYGG
jgi:leucyl aminopeptidase